MQCYYRQVSQFIDKPRLEVSALLPKGTSFGRSTLRPRSAVRGAHGTSP